ncbi:MAG: hypothetical protein GY772_12110, partial [bacterium]|nr:hypothetical protein [bacterium]
MGKGAYKGYGGPRGKYGAGGGGGVGKGFGGSAPARGAGGGKGGVGKGFGGSGSARGAGGGKGGVGKGFGGSAPARGAGAGKGKKGSRTPSRGPDETFRGPDETFLCSTWPKTMADYPVDGPKSFHAFRALAANVGCTLLLKGRDDKRRPWRARKLVIIGREGPVGDLYEILLDHALESEWDLSRVLLKAEHRLRDVAFQHLDQVRTRRAGGAVVEVTDDRDDVGAAAAASSTEASGSAGPVPADDEAEGGMEAAEATHPVRWQDDDEDEPSPPQAAGAEAAEPSPPQASTSTNLIAEVDLSPEDMDVDVGGSAPVAEPPPAAARDAGGSAPVTAAAAAQAATPPPVAKPPEPGPAAAAAAQAPEPPVAHLPEEFVFCMPRDTDALNAWSAVPDDMRRNVLRTRGEVEALLRGGAQGGGDHPRGMFVSVVTACWKRHWQLRTTIGPNLLLLQRLMLGSATPCKARLVAVLFAADTEAPATAAFLRERLGLNLLRSNKRQKLLILPSGVGGSRTKQGILRRNPNTAVIGWPWQILEPTP